MRLALTKLVEIAGEAANHVSSELQEAHPDVPWSAAASMRDRRIHHYFDINLDVLWSTVTEDLPGCWPPSRATLSVIDSLRSPEVEGVKPSSE